MSVWRNIRWRTAGEAPLFAKAVPSPCRNACKPAIGVNDVNPQQLIMNASGAIVAGKTSGRSGTTLPDTIGDITDSITQAVLLVYFKS
jgi:hypothetical protein